MIEQMCSEIQTRKLIILIENKIILIENKTILIENSCIFWLGLFC